MMLRVPLAAPSLPPLTGASSIWTPRFSQSRGHGLGGLRADRAVVNHQAPGRAPWITPFSPKSTWSTSGVSLTQIRMMSQCAATSAGLAPSWAPCATRSSMRLAVRFQTVSGKPAFRTLAAIPRPMIPKPTNPIRSVMIPSKLKVNHDIIAARPCWGKGKEGCDRIQYRKIWQYAACASSETHAALDEGIIDGR